MHLLERDYLLAALAGYAEDARNGDPRLVLVAGEAGVGKTTLVEALRDQTRDAARWLWGACDGAFTPIPLGPVFDVASQTKGALAEAATPDAPREQIFRAVLNEITWQSQLTVLVIEDAHWADEATLDLLRFVARRLRDARTLVIVTYRDEGLDHDHPLRTTLGEIATERATRRVGLSPLTHDAVRRLATGTGLEADRLYALTAGNPYLVTEVIAAGTHEVPPSARDAILARAGRLSPDARRVLDAAAVIGTRIDVEVLRAVTDDNITAIDECVTAGTLVSDAHVFRFRHELARRAVEDALPAHRRTDLHRRILDALLATTTDDDVAIAHHADAVGDATLVLEHAPRAAARAAALGAHNVALTHYERAARYAEHLAPTDRAQLWAALADEASLVDRWETARDAREHALDIWEQVGDPLRVGDTWRSMVRVLWRLCRSDEAAAAARKALDILEQLPPSVELADAYECAAVMSPTDEQCIAYADRAIALAEQLGAHRVLGQALITRGGVLIVNDVDAFADLERARDIGVTDGYDDVLGRAHTNLHELSLATFRIARAHAYYDDAMAFAGDHEIDTFASCLYAGHARAFEREGRWDEALTLLTDVLGRRHVSPINRLITVTCTARIQARRGETAAAAAALEEANALVGTADPGYVLDVYLTRLELAWLDGRDADAVAAYDLIVEMLPRLAVWDYAWVAGWAVLLDRAGDLDGRTVPGPAGLALAGDWRGAADGWLALSCPYDAALALLAATEEAPLREAADLLDGLGATAALAVAQDLMRRRGVAAIPRGRRATTRADEFGLTRREREVLGLICEGRTNAEIAGALFLTEKTVGHHVSAVLRKMGVSSRREAAARAGGVAAGGVPVASA